MMQSLFPVTDIKASVIIPCFNAADTLHVQLAALSKQQWSEPWEVIFSDNGSTDGSFHLALQYADRLPNLKVIDASAVKGPAFARNKGAEAARGESLLFCDADDEVAPGWVAAMGNALKQNDFVACRFENKKLSDPLTVAARKCPQETGIQTYNYPPFLPHAGAGGMGIKRSLHLAVGGFDETMPMLEDTDYCWRVQLAGTSLAFVPEALIHYRMRQSIPAMLRQARLWGEFNVYLYKKYRPFGMPKLSKKNGLQKTVRLLKNLPRNMNNREARLKWLWHCAWQFGRVIGSTKYRVFAL